MSPQRIKKYLQISDKYLFIQFKSECNWGSIHSTQIQCNCGEDYKRSHINLCATNAVPGWDGQIKHLSPSADKTWKHSSERLVCCRWIMWNQYENITVEECLKLKCSYSVPIFYILELCYDITYLLVRYELCSTINIFCSTGKIHYEEELLIT